MAMTTPAQIHQDKFGMQTKQQMLFSSDSRMMAPAKITAEEALGCPEGTVFGGEFKQVDGVWSGVASADEGRKDMASSFYQHFSDCYYKFNGVRFLGFFNYFDEEKVRWIFCSERGGMNEDGDMTKPIKVKVAFYDDNGENGLPGTCYYSKVFDVIGEKTGVRTGDNTSGYSQVYAFNVDLGEELAINHGYMQINAIDEHDETLGCFFSLFTASSSPDQAVIKVDMRDGSEPEWGHNMSCCYCLDGDGSFISQKAVKLNRIMSPSASNGGKYEKVQVEVMNIGSDDLNNVTLQLWQDGKLLAMEKVDANLKSLDTYKYTFKQRVDCSDTGTHHIVIKNVTPNSDLISADNISFDVETTEGATYAESFAAYDYYYITRVKIGDIDNESEATPYSDFTHMKTDIRPGESLTLKVEENDSEMYTLAWVDWNENGKFEDSEMFFFDENLETEIEIPTGTDIKPGEKRLRIVMSYDTPLPEGEYYFGETEDYTLVVKNNEGTPALGINDKPVYMTAENNSKTATLDITNNGGGTLSADVDFCYILPNAPTSNYSMKKTSVAPDIKANIIKKAVAKAANNPSKTDDIQYVLRYDNGLVESIGIENAADATYASYYPGEMLASLKGMKISSVDVFLATPAKKNSIVIYGENDQNHCGDLITEQAFEAEEGLWNRIVLDNPVTIGDKDLWIGYKAVGLIPEEYNIGVDNGKSVVGFGDRVNIGESTWWSMSDLGIDYNYCIRANVTGERTPAISWLAVDNKQLNVEETKTGKVNVNVDASKLDNALYEAKIEIKTNDELRSVINIPVYVLNGKTVGIIAKELTGGAAIKVSGKSIDISSDKTISNVEVYDLSGSLVKAMSVDSKSLNTTVEGLNGKLYILKVNYKDGSHSTVKVPVIK